MLRLFLSDTVDLVAKKRFYIPYLLLLSFSSGAIDVFSVTALGVFVANNTGNVIFLALAASQVDHKGLIRVHAVAAIVSLAGSWLGSFTAGKLGNTFGRRTRVYVFLTALFQALLVLVCCALYWSNAVVLHDGRTEYATVAILGFAMGSQNVSVKGMGAPATISVQVTTTNMADLFSDPNLFKLSNQSRNERVAFLLTIFTGGICGGFAYAFYSSTLCLLLVAIVKAIAALCILLLPAARESAKDEEKMTHEQHQFETAEASLIRENMKRQNTV